VLGPLAHTRAGLMSDVENDVENWFGGGHDCIPTLDESAIAVNMGRPQRPMPRRVSMSIPIETTVFRKLLR
jgi:coproporphyrinogen III oxidase